MACTYETSNMLIGCGICGILALPSPLQIELFSEWLGLADLGRLDSAICNTIHRRAVLNLWEDEHCIFRPKEELLLGEYFAAWVGNRRLKIERKLSVPEFVSETEACKTFFEATGNFLPMLVYPGNFMFQSLSSAESVSSMKSFVDRASTCANLKELIMVRINMNKVSLKAVLENCTQLKSLRLMFAECLNFQELNQFGRYLEHLDLIAYGGKACPEEIPPNTDYRLFTKTSTLKKLSCLCLPPGFDRARLAGFICANVGLQELELDTFELHHVFWFLESCRELLALRVNVVERDMALDDEDDVEQLVGGMQRMKYLRLVGVKFQDAWILQVLRGCAQLRQLYLHEFEEGVDEIPEDVHAEKHAGPTAPLTVLHVSSIKTSTLSEILGSYPSITNVGIGRSTLETFDSVLQVLHDRKVPELHLSVPGKYTYGSIHLLKDLSTLCLYDCKGLTDKHLLTIARNNRTLTTLRIHSAKLITCEAVLELSTLCTQLKILVVDDGRDSDELEVEDVVRTFYPFLDTVKVCLKR